jgi:aminoglycoside phosphotransferase (APT) family kinase protein
VLDAAAVVDGGVLVRDVSRRNLNMLVSRDSGPAVFVKRGSGIERAWYRRIAAVPALAPLVPPVHAAGDGSDLLLIEAEPGATDLWEHHRGVEAFPAGLGRDVGRALALLHRAPRAMADGVLARHPPALSIHRPPVDALRELTPATLRLVRMVQRHPTAGGALDWLRGSWGETAVIHDDVKWPNILALPRPGGAPAAIRLIDWEHAGLGDPAWDLGSALAAYLTFWIASISPGPGAHGAEDLAASAHFPLEAMRPAIEACWAGYGATSGVGDVDETIRRAAGFAAARLLQTAYEATEATGTVSGTTSLHLQVGLNALDDPARAAVQLLGLGGGPEPAAE